jgi:transcriptional regulator with XRE-family HTH domain
MTIFLRQYNQNIVNVGKNIKKIRDQKKLLPKDVAATAGLHPANYNKTEKREREPSIEAVDKISNLFGITVDEIIHFEGKVPDDVKIEDKTTNEKLRLLE